jgi:hypothetical protein
MSDKLSRLTYIFLMAVNMLIASLTIYSLGMLHRSHNEVKKNYVQYK